MLWYKIGTSNAGKIPPKVEPKRAVEINDVLSLSSGVITDDNPQKGTSCTVNATPQRIYVTRAQMNAALEPCSNGAVKSNMVVIAIGTGAKSK